MLQRNLDLALTEEAETGGNNYQIRFENHGIDARYTGPHEVALPCQPGMEQEEQCPTGFRYAGEHIAGNIIDREVQNGGNGLDASRIYPYTLTSADRLQCSAAREVMNFVKSGNSDQSARQHKDATDLV